MTLTRKIKKAALYKAAFYIIIGELDAKTIYSFLQLGQQYSSFSLWPGCSVYKILKFLLQFLQCILLQILEHLKSENIVNNILSKHNLCKTLYLVLHKMSIIFKIKLT